MTKDPATEELLARLNDRLADAELPGPEPDPAGRELPLVYVVGVPRSGNTVLAQLLCRHLPLGYIDNLSARFWRRPSVGITLSRAVVGPWGSREIELESRYGVTSGAPGPHEFGYFWRHWLRLDQARTHHLSHDEQEALDHGGLKRALELEILQSAGTPVLLRNPICGFHARLLSKLHPLSLFVWIRRSPIDVARSILRCRMELYGSYTAWWSLKPSTWPFSDVDGAAAEVARQVLDCQRELAEELSDGANTLQVEYEALLQDPPAVLELVRDQLESMGAPLQIRGDVPKQLRGADRADRREAAHVLPDPLEQRLVELLGPDR